jgi:hypothetical protein
LGCDLARYDGGTPQASSRFRVTNSSRSASLPRFKLPLVVSRTLQILNAIPAAIASVRSQALVNAHLPSTHFSDTTQHCFGYAIVLILRRSKLTFKGERKCISVLPRSLSPSL